MRFNEKFLNRMYAAIIGAFSGFLIARSVGEYYLPFFLILFAMMFITTFFLKGL